MSESIPLGHPLPETLKMTDLQAELEAEMPGVRIVPDMSTYGVKLGITLQAHGSYMMMPEDHALPYLRQLIEQLRLRAIHELGLRPRLDAYEADARQAREEARIARAQRDEARRRVGELQLELDALRAEVAGED